MSAASAPVPRSGLPIALSPRTATYAALTALAVLFPVLPMVPGSMVGSANQGAAYALVAVSLVVLTGWVGQISLGHAAFVGVGAYATGWAANAAGLPFPLSVPVAAGVGAVTALVLGAVALRVRGLYLAVATLIFSWTADEYLFRQPWITEHSTMPGQRIGAAGELPSFDLTSRVTVYYIAWALVVAGLLVAANVRDSKTGRAFYAVRGSEIAAASLGIDVTRVKLLAFGFSGALAGVAGSVVMGSGRVLSPDQFTFTVSFFFLAVAVVGGIQSLPGAVASALLFASLSELFFRVEALGGYLEVVSTGLLLAVMLLHRGGLAAAGSQVADLVRRGRAATPTAKGAGDAGDADAGEPGEVAAGPGELDVDVSSGAKSSARSQLAGIPRQERPVVAEVRGLTVTFGGLTAVEAVDLRVHEGEIVGLIGPNGAGKTVTFNCIAGLVQPTTGQVLLRGRDVSRTPVHERARMGVARTFQIVQLFPQLSVEDNLLVATHSQNASGFVDHVVVSRRSVSAERRARRQVAEVMARTGLTAVAGERVAGLPFGVLRTVELARALVTGYPFVMLDEAASGLDNQETDAMVELLRSLNHDGVTLLVIEHDVKMVTSLCDHLYVLDRGKLIADGPPEDVARDPRVVAAYIGTSAAAAPEASPEPVAVPA